MERATFQLERFVWGGPDRLVVAGRFAGVDPAAIGEPMLAVQGADGVHRLPPVAGSGEAPNRDHRWSAEFAWREPPVPFEFAVLELGAGREVRLPEPRAKRRPFFNPLLEVQLHEEATASGDASATAERPPAAGAGVAAEDVERRAAELVGEAELRRLRAAVARAEEDAARTRADLEAEREGRAADAEGFRSGVEQLRAGAHRLGERLAERDRQLEQLRAALAAAAGERESEVAALRARVEEAEHEAGALRARAAAAEREAAELRIRVSQADEARQEAAALRERAERAERARAAMEPLHAEARDLLGRFAALGDAPGDER